MKAGDTVRCIDNECNAYVVTVGKTYTVGSAADPFINIVEGDNGQQNYGIYARRFEVVEPIKVRRVPMAHANTQLSKVLGCVLGQGAWTLAAIASATGASEAAASARLRDLRANGYIVTCTKPKGDKQRVYTVETAAVAA